MANEDYKKLSQEECSVLELLEKAQKEYSVYEEITSISNPFIMSEEKASEKYNWDNPLTLAFSS